MMADGGCQRTEATDGSHYHLLLLKTPLSATESVEELLDIELGMQDNALPAKVDEISDPGVLAACFGHPGKAVLLHDAQAFIIKNYASRHKAIFTINMISLDDDQYQLARTAVLGIRFPIWVFISGDVAHSCNWSDPSVGFDMIGREEETCLWRRKSYLVTMHAGSDSASDKKKLRPAQDILNRLRHDPEHNEDDYKVVYEDRFLGEVSINLSQWVSDTTDEEFVPQHRIIRFDRRWDECSIWNRRKRIDALFGSMGSGIRREPGLAYEIPSVERLIKLENSIVGLHRGQVRKAMLEFEDRPGEQVKGLAYDK